MTGTGRPLRFLVALIGLWIGVRVVQLWPAGGATVVASVIGPPADASARPLGTKALLAGRAATVAGIQRRYAVVHRHAAFVPAATKPGQPPSPSAELPAPSAPLSPAPQPVRAAPVTLQQSLPPGAPLSAPGQERSRFAGSGWLIVRRGGVVPFVPQLGGSQAGVRLTYAIDAARRLSLAGRISTALASRQSEAAIGLDWQPFSLPVHIVAEQRIGIDRARGGPSLGLIGGIGPTPVVGRLQVDAYAQGGAIARDGLEGFVDGAVRLSQPVVALGPARIELGLGAWGAAQRGAARIDAGPAAAAILPVAGKAFRLSLEWRQRLAGRATPTSGPALSLGTDF